MQPKDVLVVDDEPLMRDTLDLGLRGEFRVFKAASGREALKLAAQQNFPLVVLDLRMEGLDGIATLKRLRRRNPSQKIVILTAHQSMESAIEAVNSGAHGYLTKPCDLKELRGILSEAHDRYFAEQARMEASRERILELHDDFFSVLCHEFNTPLNGIINLASVLKEMLDDEGMRKMADAIESSANNLHQVFLEILDYISSKTNSDANPLLPFTGHDLTTWLNRNRDLLDIDYTLRGQFWTSERSFKGPFHSLRAIISKVIMAGGRSEQQMPQVLAHLSDEQLVIEISDLDIESRYGNLQDPESIFQPYSSPSSARNSFDTGVGLHFATCRNLAETAGINLRTLRLPGERIKIRISLELLAGDS